jgi:DNA-binding MarR family transcriptional regulator
MAGPKMDKQADSVIRLFRAILRAGMSVGCEVRPLFAQHDLTPPQWDVLCALAQADPGGMMLSEISQQLLVTGGNITGLVDRLEEAGLVKRLPHPQDRRVVLAVLTERGEEVYGQVFPEYCTRLKELLGGGYPQRRAGLTEALEQLTAEVMAARGRQFP